MTVTSKPTRYKHLDVKSHKCSDCGRKQQYVIGAVYDQNNDLLSAFGASLRDHKCPTGEHSDTRWVLLRMGIHLEDEKGARLEKKSFSFALATFDGQIYTAVVTGPDDPPGEGLTKDEALANPFMPLVSEVESFIVDHEH